MKNIPFSRKLFYLILLGFLPLFLVTGLYVKERQAWQKVREHITSVSHQSHLKAQKQALNIAVRKAHEDVDANYIERLERLPFLVKEKEALETLFSSRSFTGNEAAERRHAFLSGGENRLLFAEKDVQVADKVRETLEVLAHPVEINHTDLRTFLTLVEGKHPKQPQLLITDLKLAKKSKADGNEIFELTCAFIKREFEK